MWCSVSWGGKLRNETKTAGAWVEETEWGGSLSSAFFLWVTLIGWWPAESPQALVLGEYFRKRKLNVKEKLQYFEQKTTPPRIKWTSRCIFSDRQLNFCVTFLNARFFYLIFFRYFIMCNFGNMLIWAIFCKFWNNPLNFCNFTNWNLRY